MKLFSFRKAMIAGVAVCALSLVAFPVLAANQPAGKCPDKSPGCTNLIVQIPGFLGGSVANPVEYILGIYRFSLSVGGLLAMAIIVFAGIKRITSAGNPSAISEANDMITNALWGLALLFGAFLILSTINPKLTTISLETLNPISVAADSHNVYSNFDELSKPLSDATQNDLAKARAAADAAQKLADDTAGLIADRQPDKSKWTPEQSARVTVAEFQVRQADYVVEELQAKAADINFNSVNASICGSPNVSCENGYMKGMTPDQQRAYNQALQTKNGTAATVKNELDYLNKNESFIREITARYNIQLQQK